MEAIVRSSGYFLDIMNVICGSTNPVSREPKYSVEGDVKAPGTERVTFYQRVISS